MCWLRGASWAHLPEPLVASSCRLRRALRGSSVAAGRSILRVHQETRRNSPRCEDRVLWAQVRIPLGAVSNLELAQNSSRRQQQCPPSQPVDPSVYHRVFTGLPERAVPLADVGVDPGKRQCRKTFPLQVDLPIWGLGDVARPGSSSRSPQLSSS